jgi:hypothetical protein
MKYIKLDNRQFPRIVPIENTNNQYKVISNDIEIARGTIEELNKGILYYSNEQTTSSIRQKNREHDKQHIQLELESIVYYIVEGDYNCRTVNSGYQILEWEKINTTTQITKSGLLKFDENFDVVWNNMEKLLRTRLELEKDYQFRKNKKGLEDLIKSKSIEDAILKNQVYTVEYRFYINSELEITNKKIIFTLKVGDRTKETEFRYNDDYGQWVIHTSNMSKNTKETVEDYFFSNIEEFEYILSKEPKRDCFLLPLLK